MKTSPFIGTSQLQALSLSKSLDNPKMKKTVAETASRHLSISVPLVQPAISISKEQLGSATPEQSKIVDGVRAKTSELSSALFS